MGCTASKQYGPSGLKKRSEKTASSWYAPLTRSSSTPMPQYPILEPFDPLTEHGRCSFHDDNPLQYDTGSFVRLLYKKKSISPTPGQSASIDQYPADHHHHNHHHQQHHNHRHHHHQYCEHDAGLMERKSSIKKRTSPSNHPQNGHTNGDDYHPSLQQLQLVKLSAHKSRHMKKDSSSSNRASEDERSAPFLDRYSECSPPSKGSIKHGNIDFLRRGGKQEGMTDGMDAHRDLTPGLRERRRSRFAPAPDKLLHRQKSKNAEKPLLCPSTAVGLDNESAQMGSSAAPPKHTHTVEHPLRKRKKSRDVSDPDLHASLEGLEEKLQKLSDEAINAAEQQTEEIKGLVETESPDEDDVESKVPGSCPPSSAFNEVTSGGSQLSSPLRSPSKSSVKSSTTSPLFDPHLLAMFEGAVESVRYCCAEDDDWLLVNDISNEPSSLSSSDKFQWVSSEPSSDEESRQSGELFSSEILHDDKNPPYNDGKSGCLHDGIGINTKRHKVDGVLYPDLDRFEVKCPPRGEDRVVFYFTSLRGVRRTYQNCCTVRLILQGLGVDVDERDVWMHLKFREELTDLLGDRGLPVPRLFIKGRYIGGAEEVQQLHEDGLLVRLIEDLPTKFRKSCDGCADVRFVPCLTCRGSRKLLDYEQDQMIRCFDCNENGLIMCPLCRS